MAAWMRLTKKVSIYGGDLDRATKSSKPGYSHREPQSQHVQILQSISIYAVGICWLNKHCTSTVCELLITSYNLQLCTISPLNVASPTPPFKKKLDSDTVLSHPPHSLSLVLLRTSHRPSEQSTVPEHPMGRGCFTCPLGPPMPNLQSIVGYRILYVYYMICI